MNALSLVFAATPLPFRSETCMYEISRYIFPLVLVTFFVVVGFAFVVGAVSSGAADADAVGLGEGKLEGIENLGNGGSGRTNFDGSEFFRKSMPNTITNASNKSAATDPNNAGMGRNRG